MLHAGRNRDVRPRRTGAADGAVSAGDGQRHADRDDGEPVHDRRLPVRAAGRQRPCVTAQWIVGATRITAGGMPVLAANQRRICAPTATPLNIVLTQTRVSGI